MNITQILLFHWYAGCSLIGNLFIHALDRHAQALTKVEVEQVDTEKLIKESWNLGVAYGNHAHNKITGDIQGDIINAFKKVQASEAAKTVLEQLPTPAQGS